MVSASRHATYFELVETPEKGGCPICRLAERGAEQRFTDDEAVGEGGLNKGLDVVG